MTGEAATPKGRSAWSWVLGGGLAAVLLYYSLRGTDWRRVWSLILGAHWEYLAGGVAISLVTFWLRSIRWRVLLNAAARFEASTVFWAMMAGYLGNNFLPARAGELVRSFLLSGRSKLSKTYVLTTALTERLADAIVLVLCGSVIVMNMDKKPAWMDGVSRSTTALALAGAFGIAILPVVENLARRILWRLPVPHGLRDRVWELIEQIVLGLRTFHHGGRLASFLALTLLIWAVDATSIMVGVHVLGLSVSFPVALLLLVGLGLGSALPSTPGYVGIYQFVAVTVLTPFGIERDAALAYIILSQAMGYVVVLVLGSLGLWRLRGQTATVAA
jgi:uncharacterized protein (TIRG00374 family)